MLYSTSLTDAMLLHDDRSALGSQRICRAKRPLNTYACAARGRAAPFGHHGYRSGSVLHLVGTKPKRTDRLFYFTGNADRLAVVLAGIRQQRLDRCRLGVARHKGEQDAGEQQSLSESSHTQRVSWL